MVDLDAAVAAGRVARRLEPLHSMIYFAPEAEPRFTAAGLDEGRMTYFAPRAAPMGAVSASVVTATFYNFSPALVAASIPRAWSLVAPSDLVGLRFEVADTALRRLLGDELLASPELAEAAGLARTAAEAADPQGRALAAGHMDLAWPHEPHLVLWHALSILREHRGDGHVALLLDAGLTGLEALVSATAAGGGFTARFARGSRGWSEQEWDAARSGLVERGLLELGDGEGGAVPTEQGAGLRRAIEEDTHRLGAGPWAVLGSDGVARLGELAAPLVRAALANGAFPARGVFAARR